MKPRNTVIFFAIAIPLGAGAWWLWSTSRGATKSPVYKLVRTEGPVEIRDYPPLTVVNAPMVEEGMDTSFRKLFRYITGGNAKREKIAMTTPVLIASDGGKRRMSFIMPESAVSGGVPKPADESVSIGAVDAGRFAVMRFGGGRSDANEANAIEMLTQWMGGNHLAARGAPIIAYYDPPWTPLFLRRNEVMIPVAD